MRHDYCGWLTVRIACCGRCSSWRLLCGVIGVTGSAGKTTTKDAVAQVLARNIPTPIEYVGTHDTFGESGTPEELLKKYHLDTPDIVAAAEKVIARKNK